MRAVETDHESSKIHKKVNKRHSHMFYDFNHEDIILNPELKQHKPVQEVNEIDKKIKTAIEEWKYNQLKSKRIEKTVSNIITQSS
mmetsp:Transcript_12030/g.13681  ORF Transcript_12030/g.13681 Transcript_12030/m.13681 type:complete len:85 (-) Transcript_12030:98-352(-)